MKRKLFISVMALAACVMASGSFAQDVPGIKGESSQPQEQVKTIFSFKNEISLTEEQENKIKAVLYDEQIFVNASNAALKNLAAELGDMIEKKSAMNVIRSKFEEISRVQVDVSCRNIEDGRKVETILTPVQLEKWKEIQKKFASQAKM